MPRPSRPVASAVTAAALAVALALPAASAAAGFGPPQPLRYGGPSALTGTPAVVLNEDGLGVAVGDSGGSAASGAAGPSTNASAFTNGVFLDPVTFTHTNTAVGPGDGQLAPYAHTGLAVAGLHRTHTTAGVVLGLGRLLPNRASSGAVRPVGPSNLHAFAPVLAADAEGDLAMVWAVCRDAGCRRSLVYLATRPAGSSHVTTTRLAEASDTLPRVAVAINDRGDALGVWTDDTSILARIRTAGGTLRATQRAGTTQHGSLAPPSAALSLHRAELVGWSTQVVHEGDATAGEVRVAQSRGGTFAATRVSALPAALPPLILGRAVRVAFDSTGLRHLAWTGHDGPAFTVSTALLHGAANAATATLVGEQVVSGPASDTVLDDFDLAGGRELVTLRAARQGAAGEVVQTVERRSAQGPYTRADVSAADAVTSPADAALLAGRAVVVYGSGAQDDRYVEEVG
jgi:hypothetical protein